MASLYVPNNECTISDTFDKIYTSWSSCSSSTQQFVLVYSSPLLAPKGNSKCSLTNWLDIFITVLLSSIPHSEESLQQHHHNLHPSSVLYTHAKSQIQKLTLQFYTIYDKCRARIDKAILRYRSKILTATIS